jgi:inosine-uridine nucleoside N-ribohydrolase
LIDPVCSKTQSVPVFVETEGHCKGKTTADWHKQWENRVETEVCMEVDSSGVLDLIKERLTK